VVLSDKLRGFQLAVLRRLPGHGENFIGRSDEFLRVAVTIEAPFHVERVHPPRNRHLIDATMAGGAADSFCHVDAVIEIDVVG